MNSRTLCTSPNIARKRRRARAQKNIIPMRVRSVMRSDLIHPRALQRVMKKNTPIIEPTMSAGRGSRKSDAIQMATRVMATAIAVFMTVFQSDTGSSLRLAKKRKRRLKIPRMLSQTTIQNKVFLPVKYV
jgi:hypothetical protein